MAEYTTDADLALDPSLLSENPPLGQVLEGAGFYGSTSTIGIWKTRRRTSESRDIDVQVDLLVPATVSPGSGHRAARLPGERITTKANRKREGALWSGRTILQLIRSPLYFGKVLSGPVFVEGVQLAIVDEELTIAACEAITRRRTRQPSRRSLFSIEQDPYLLRHVLLCGKCRGPMTTSASQAVTIENADEVPRYYRCRGSSHGPACRPTVQVAAREVEQEVLRQLQAPGSIRDLPPNARRFLENVAPLWPSLPRNELNHWVRTFVWAATWNPDTRKVEVVFDEVGLENAMAENPELLNPLPEKVVRKLPKREVGKR